MNHEDNQGIADVSKAYFLPRFLQSSCSNWLLLLGQLKDKRKLVGVRKLGFQIRDIFLRY